MSRLIVEVEVSLDGVMGGTDPMAYWSRMYGFHSTDVQAYLDDLLKLADALVMGRKTYEAFAQVWPTRQGAAADRINAMPKHVASRTRTAPLQWHAALIKGEAAEGVARLKRESKGTLLQYGVGELTGALLGRGLIDELRVLVSPIVFGEGARIFERVPVHTFQLLETTRFESGVVAHHYRPASAA